MTKATFYGYNPPFVGSIRGILPRQEDAQIIKNDILQLLLTKPGERIYRPDFGTSISNLVFDNINTSTIEIIKNEITDALARHEPRVSVKSINVVNVEHDLYIKLVVALKSDPKVVLDITRKIGAEVN